MKKSLILAAMASVALASCVNDVADVQQQEQKQVKIMFDSPVMYNNNAGTRANVWGEISNETVSGHYSYPSNELFQIYAIQYEKQFPGWDNELSDKAEFDNTPIAHDESLGGWAPKNGDDYYFWPGGNMKMAFAACSPADLACSTANRTYSATGLQILNFQISPDAATQYDLMFSQRVIDKTSSDMLHSEGMYSGIPLQFQHALTSVRFSIQNTSNETVVLTGIKVYGAQDTGNFYENITNENSLYSIADGTVAPYWDQEEHRVAEGEAYVAFQGNLPFTSNPEYVYEKADKENGDLVNMLLLLPQVLTEDVKIVVDYTVNGKPATKTVEAIDATPITTSTPIGNGGEWIMGYRYTYRLLYSLESADKDKIYFAPSSDDWQNAGIYQIELL